MVRLVDARRPREGISLTQYLEQFAPDEEDAEAWRVAGRTASGAHIALPRVSRNVRIDVSSRTDDRRRSQGHK